MCKRNVPDSELGSGGLEFLGELVVNALLNVDSGSSTTSLTVVEAGISERTRGHWRHLQDTLASVCDGIVDIGIVKDDVGTLSTELKRNLLQVSVRSLLEDLLSDCGRTGKGDLVDSWGGSKSLTDGRTVTDNDVDDTSGDTGLLDELRHVHGGKGCQLGRLHDDGTSGSKCGSDLPGEHVKGLDVRTVLRLWTGPTYEVPWDDLTTDTNGLVSGESKLVFASFDGFTVNLVCPSTVVSEDGGGLGNIESLGNGKGLSVVEGLEGSKDIDISLHQGGDLHEHLASLETGDIETPGGLEGSMRGIERSLDIGTHTLWDLDEDLAGGGVVDTAH